jgi:hypothetical protein
MLACLLPLAWKQASALEGKHKPHTQILNINQNQLTVQMTDKELDTYLAGDDTMKIDVINSVSEQDALPEEPKQITLEATGIKENRIKIQHGTLSNILSGTDVQITKKQSLNLFGKTLADTNGKDYVEAKEPNMADYDHIFSPGKTNLPQGTYHVMKVQLILDEKDPTIGRRAWKCINCGAISYKEIKDERDLCPGKNLEKSDNSETTSEQ